MIINLPQIMPPSEAAAHSSFSGGLFHEGFDRQISKTFLFLELLEHRLVLDNNAFVNNLTCDVSVCRM